MIRKLLALLGHPDVGAALAVTAVGIGVSYLQGWVADRQQEMQALDAAIADRTARLAGINADIARAVHKATEPYPTPVDVDPLQRVAAADLPPGLELVDVFQPGGGRADVDEP